MLISTMRPPPDSPRPTTTLIAALALSLLAACTAPPAPEVAPPTPVTPPAAPPVAAQVYTLAPDRSTLHILVYRGGTLARLGHNHVISSRHLGGRIWLGPTLESSGFDLSVPVQELIVDDDAARNAAGPDFPPGVPQAAREGTRTNMLRETLLDGARHPLVRIQSLRLQGDPATPQVQAALRIRDQTREVTLPVQVQTTEGHLEVRGEFPLRQSDFGITPLSVAMGALQVVDTVTVKFHLVGTRP